MASKTRSELFTAVSKSGLMGSIANGAWDGALTGSIPVGDNFGWWNYENTLPPQVIPASTWTTIMNNGAGSNTDISFRPDGLSDILDKTSGKILLNELNVGDEIYIRHIINIIPQVRASTCSFGHRFGSSTQTRVPTGMKILLDEGGGIATDFFLLDGHFYVKGEEERIAGVLPQVFVSNTTTVEYKGCYISVTRR